MFTPLQKQLFVISGAMLNDLTAGLIHGFPAVLLLQLNDSKESGLSSHDVATIASVLPLSGIIGSLLAPFLMNRYGRKLTHLMATFPFAAGWIVAAFSSNTTMLLISRLLHGFGLGLRTASSGVLVAEYSDRRYRGAFLGSFAISLGLGVYIAHLIGNSLSWRTCSLVFAVVPFLAMIIISLSPESPHWLASKGEFDKCRNVFTWLRGDDTSNKLELDRLIFSQKSEKNYSKGFHWRLLKTRSFIIPAIIAMTVEVLFEFGGAHILPAYGNIILSNVLKKKDVSFEFSVLDLIRVFAAIPGIIIVKNLNRKTILLMGCLATIACFLSISIYIALIKRNIVERCYSFGFSIFIIYSVAYCMCVLPLIPILCNEVFPLSVRSLGAAFNAVMLGPIFTISLKTAPMLFVTIGIEGAYLMYACILLIALFIIYLLLPETKDRTLQEIESHFTRIREPFVGTELLPIKILPQ